MSLVVVYLVLNSNAKEKDRQQSLKKQLPLESQNRAFYGQLVFMEIFGENRIKMGKKNNIQIFKHSVGDDKALDRFKK